MLTQKHKWRNSIYATTAKSVSSLIDIKGKNYKKNQLLALELERGKLGFWKDIGFHNPRSHIWISYI